MYVFVLMISGVGTLMQPARETSAGPPPATYAITTEAGVKLTTEADEPIRTDQS